VQAQALEAAVFMIEMAIVNLKSHPLTLKLSNLGHLRETEIGMGKSGTEIKILSRQLPKLRAFD
jgi:hypothetical protein